MKLNEQSQWELQITLRSDLCVATGDGFSSSIDIDVCRDQNGLPYIPARRLKGCLREAAMLVVDDDEREAVEELFGRRGSDRPGSIVVGDARIRTLGGLDVTALSAANPNQVFELLTYVRASTALVPGEGYAKENSLRYTRVVKQYDPLATGDGDPSHLGEPLVFFATVLADEKYALLLDRAARALRSIGFNRNRGLGAVSCRLKAVEAAPPNGWGLSKATRIAYKVCLALM